MKKQYKGLKMTTVKKSEFVALVGNVQVPMMKEWKAGKGEEYPKYIRSNIFGDLVIGYYTLQKRNWFERLLGYGTYFLVRLEAVGFENKSFPVEILPMKPEVLCQDAEYNSGNMKGVRDFRYKNVSSLVKKLNNTAGVMFDEKE